MEAHLEGGASSPPAPVTGLTWLAALGWRRRLPFARPRDAPGEHRLQWAEEPVARDAQRAGEHVSEPSAQDDQVALGSRNEPGHGSERERDPHQERDRCEDDGADLEASSPGELKAVECGIDGPQSLLEEGADH